MDLHIGCSGWNYRYWKGPFYPESVKQKEWLAFYARKFDTLELNVTFYGQPAKATFERWYATVPDRFFFSVKMSRFITHTMRLEVRPESIMRFSEGVSLLADKLGIVLIQLPPTLHFDAGVMKKFFSLLDPTFRYTVEARHESFVGEPFFKLLRRNNIAWCISETGGRYPYSEAVTADFVYVRLHGRQELYASRYTDDELRAWKKKIESWGRETYVYFDNDFAGYAPMNALTLRTMLGV